MMVKLFQINYKECKYMNTEDSIDAITSSFRLTIRNVNFNFFNFIRTFWIGFRLTIRNVNRV